MVLCACPVSFAAWRSFVLIICVPCILCSLAVPGVWGCLGVTQQEATVRDKIEDLHYKDGNALDEYPFRPYLPFATLSAPFEDLDS